jgi:uncharacterized protein YkwD
LLSYLLFIFSCQKSDTGTAQNNTQVNTTALNRNVMLQLVNDQRQRGCNCGTTYYAPTTTLTWNDKLENAAATHAGDMLTNNYFSHTGLDNSNPGDRIMRAGYNWRAYGENIAKGFSSEQEVMAAWIQSEDHCQNIMNPNYREMGAARANSYWVQEFGAQ